MAAEILLTRPAEPGRNPTTQSQHQNTSSSGDHTLIKPLFSPYIAFKASGSPKDNVLGPSRTISPFCLCSLISVISGLLPNTSKKRHKSVKEAGKGPEYLLRPLLK